jgi:hypothetical protein
VGKIVTGLGLFFLVNAALAFGQAKIGIAGAVEWDKMEINATVSLDLASAGIKLPTGRIQGETLIASEYPRLIRPDLLQLQVDSSATVADLVERGEWSLPELEHLALQARIIPPALSQDFSSLSASYTLSIAGLSSTLLRHTRLAEIPRTLNPVSAPAYTGIIIIASEKQPIHGMKSAASLRPCLFPKIWDTEMNLIFERNMLNPKAGAMVSYFPQGAIFAARPSGLSPEIAAIVGERPLRIFARGVFGTQPTDPIISREDALLIISTEGNRKLLREGRVAIILDDSLLKNPLNDK